MCDVPSIAVFCSESIECVPGTASKFIIIIIIIIIIIRICERRLKIEVARALHKLELFFIILIPYPKRNLYSIILPVDL